LAQNTRLILPANLTLLPRQCRATHRASVFGQRLSTVPRIVRRGTPSRRDEPFIARSVSILLLKRVGIIAHFDQSPGGIVATAFERAAFDLSARLISGGNE
jgi:hypothetical protein